MAKSESEATLGQFQADVSRFNAQRKSELQDETRFKDAMEAILSNHKYQNCAAVVQTKEYQRLWTEYFILV